MNQVSLMVNKMNMVMKLWMEIQNSVKLKEKKYLFPLIIPEERLRLFAHWGKFKNKRFIKLELMFILIFHYFFRPNCCEIDQIVKLFDAGMTMARVNLSHGTQKQNLKLISKFKQAKRLRPHKNCALMLEVRGREIRIS